MQKLNLKLRIKWLDILKFFGIFFVIFGHLIKYESLLSRFIFSFHIPLFLFISGYLFNDNLEFGEFIKRKLKAIIIPYFSVILLGILFNYYYSRSLPNFDILGQIFYSGQPESLHVGQVWFLMSLFWVEIIYFWMSKKIKNNEQFRIAILVSAILGQAWGLFGNFLLPLKLAPALIGIVFFSVGHHLQKANFTFEYKKYFNIPVLLLSLVLTLIFGPVLNGSVNLSNQTLNNPFYYFVAAFSGIFFFATLSKIMKEDKYLEFFGQNSIIIFTTHSLVLLSIFKIHNYINNTNLNLFSLTPSAGVYFTLVVLIFEIPIIHIIKKYFPYLYGLKVIKEEKPEIMINIEKKAEKSPKEPALT